MTTVPDRITTWQTPDASTTDNNTPETQTDRLEMVEKPVPELKQGEVLVEIAGCGVGHLHIGAWQPVPPAPTGAALPPAQAISGTVVAGSPDWLGRDILLPLAIPCGACAACKAGQGHRCLSPESPIRGDFISFSSHLAVSEAYLIPVENGQGIPLEHLAVVPYVVAPLFQAARCAELGAGDRVIVLAAEGSGVFMVQMARALGAGTVICVDSAKDQFRKIRACGADHTLDANGQSAAELAAAVNGLREQNGLPPSGWKIFNLSPGTMEQETALNLTGDGDRLVLVGRSEAEAQGLNHSHPASDVAIIGTQGCPAEYYAQALEMVISGRIDLKALILTRPMTWIQAFLTEWGKAPADRLFVLTTDDFTLEYEPMAMSCR